MAGRDSQLMMTTSYDFFDMLDYEFKRAARYNNEVTLLFIKLSNLGEVSTRYGQLTASRVLSKIERLIRENIRSSDREFIYGSDEFMLILPQTPKEGANCMIPKLKRLMEHCYFISGDETHVTIIPKFGIASFPHDALTRDGVVKMADNVC
jgi:diguanylate cyclase (GGDEF)-like protein